MATRVETIAVDVHIDGASALNEHRRNIEGVLGVARAESLLNGVFAGDTVKVHWEFDCRYIGDIDLNFKSMLRILADQKVVSRVGIDELRLAESLFVRLVDRVRELQAMIQKEG